MISGLFAIVCVIDDLIALSQDAKKLMNTDVERGREVLRRYLADGTIKCGVTADGPFASCELVRAHILSEPETVESLELAS